MYLRKSLPSRFVSCTWWQDLRHFCEDAIFWELSNSAVKMLINCAKNIVLKTDDPCAGICDGIYIMIMSLPVIIVVGSIQHQCKHRQKHSAPVLFHNNGQNPFLVGTETGLKDKIIDRKRGNLACTPKSTHSPTLDSPLNWSTKDKILTAKVSLCFFFLHCCIAPTVTNVPNLVWYRSYLSSFTAEIIVIISSPSFRATVVR